MNGRLQIWLALTAVAVPVASAQDEAVPLRLQGLVPVGGRNSVTESWGTLRFTIENLGSANRDARVVVSYADRPEVQFGRDVWVPARSRITSWLTIGPAPADASESRRDIHYMLYERTGDEFRLTSTSTEPERIPSRAVLYRRREPSTAVLIDAVAGDADNLDPLGSPDSVASQAVVLTRTFRLARGLSENVSLVLDRQLPPTPETFDGIDQFVLAGNRLAAEPTGRQAIRHWVLQGGTLWVLLDRVDPDVVAPILGEGQRFQVVDKCTLTRLRLRAMTDDPAHVEARDFEQPVELVRVLLSGSETVLFEANGWPAAFSQTLGRGRVVFTTLGGRGWYRPRNPRDPPSRFESFRDIPVPLAALESLSGRIYPDSQAEGFKSEDLAPMLAAEIGYEVVSRRVAAAILVGFVLAVLALGIVLRRSRSPELIGLFGPGVAVAVAGLFVVVGTASRRAVPSTAAAAAILEISPETGEAAARGLFAVYCPESGTIDLGTVHGGEVELDSTGLAGKPRRRVQTDIDSWHWENLAFPGGVRMGPFRSTLRTRVSAVGRFGSAGMEGQLVAEKFRDVADAIILTRAGTVLAPRLDSGGSFAASPDDVLPPDQYLPGSVLTDRQQRRQNIYRKLLARPRPTHLERCDNLLAWAETENLPFTVGDSARRFGTVLLVVPLEFNRPTGRAPVTIPNGFIPYTAVTEGHSHRPTLEGSTPVRNRLRFQLPSSVLPFSVEKATLIVRVRAPGRKFSVTRVADGQAVVLHESFSPLSQIRVEITDTQALRLDPAGGLLLELALSGRIGPDGREMPALVSDPEVKWQIESLGLEVVGRAQDR